MVTKKAISSTKKSKSTNISKSKSAVTQTAKVSSLTSTKKDSKFVASLKNAYAKYRKMPIIAAIIAEFIATFALVISFFAIQAQPLYLAFILIGIVMIFGKISGAYVNPAMVIGGWITKKLSSARAICYILAEVLAAVVAWFTLNGFVSQVYSDPSYASQALFHADTITSGKEWYILLSELLGSFILGLAVSAAIRAKKNSVKSALTYGFGILIAMLFAGWATSMVLSSQYAGLAFINPAIAIATQALSWNIWPIAIFILAPVVGGTVGFLISEAIKTKEDECTCCE